jgi:hypothetical protein
LRRVEKSGEEVKRVERLEDEKLWEPLKRVVKIEKLRCLRRAAKSPEVVVTAEKGWGKMRTNSKNRVEKMWGFTPVPLGKICCWKFPPPALRGIYLYIWCLVIPLMTHSVISMRYTTPV